MPSVDCDDPACNVHEQYDSSLSSTYIEDGTPVIFNYASGTTAGIQSIDTCAVKKYYTEEIRRSNNIEITAAVKFEFAKATTAAKAAVIASKSKYKKQIERKKLQE